MNYKRREKISKIVASLKNIRKMTDDILFEEQQVFDNTPENIQDGYKGEKMQEAISQLEDAVDNIDEAIESLEGASA